MSAFEILTSPSGIKYRLLDPTQPISIWNVLDGDCGCGECYPGSKENEGLAKDFDLIYPQNDWSQFDEDFVFNNPVRKAKPGEL